MTDALREHVNTLPLRGLERDYLEAIEGIGGWAKLVRFARPASPARLLLRYDSVAAAINLKVILWVEDLERFAGIVPRVREPEYMRLAPLRALLNELSALRSIQVVLSSAAADFRFDLQKLARHVINIPPLNSQTVASEIESFRHQSLVQFPFRDAAQPAERRRLWPEDRSKEQPDFLGLGSPNLQYALTSICTTPRTLKQALRSSLEAWQKLRGEIDFDEVLMVSVIDVAEPEIVSLINKYINQLRVGSAEKLFGKKERDKSRFAEELEKLLIDSATPHAEAFQYILTELFPGWERGEGSSQKMRLKRPQGFSVEHTDYWLRYMTLIRPADANSDQRMLRLIDDWRSQLNNELPQTMVTGDFPPSLEAFLEVSTSEKELVRLLDEILEAETPRGRHNWAGIGSEYDHPPALVSVWRLMLGKPDPEDLLPMLQKHIHSALRTNLPLAFELVYFFATRSQGVPKILSAEHVDSLSKEFREAIAREFEGHPAKLADTLRGAHIYVLYWSCWGLDNVREHKTAGVPDHWERLRDTVLDAVQGEPAVMVPQLLPFIVRRLEEIQAYGHEGPVVVSTYEWNREATERLFSIERFEQVFAGFKNLQLESNEAQRMLASILAGVVLKPER